MRWDLSKKMNPATQLGERGKPNSNWKLINCACFWNKFSSFIIIHGQRVMNIIMNEKGKHVFETLKCLVTQCATYKLMIFLVKSVFVGFGGQRQMILTNWFHQRKTKMSISSSPEIPPSPKPSPKYLVVRKIQVFYAVALVSQHWQLSWLSRSQLAQLRFRFDEFIPPTTNPRNVCLLSLQQLYFRTSQY